MKTERIIVSLTTWAPRIKNIPTVLDSIFNQTLLPDLVVINFSEGEIIPIDIQKYLEEHNVECNFVPDTKVYKKLIPTLKKYPNDCVISIDDDWIYPAGMIEDFMDIHKRYPNNPISGDSGMVMNVISHCGCASLTKKDYFGSYFDVIDSDLIHHCPCDDIVYTFFANKAGYPYILTSNQYYTNLPEYNPSQGFSDNNKTANKATISYLEEKWGKIENPFKFYLQDYYLSNLFNKILKDSIAYHRQKSQILTENKIRNSITYKIGKLILTPYRLIQKMTNQQ